MPKELELKICDIDEKKKKQSSGDFISNCDFSKKGLKKQQERIEKLKEEKKKSKDPEEVTDADIAVLKKTLNTLHENVLILENNWNMTQKEFKITESQIKQVYQFNEQNRDPIPEGLSEEEQDEYDHFNGIDKMTSEDITAIFGEFGPDHPIIGVDDKQTIDRIKQAVGDFFYWLSALRQYKQADIAYMQMIEIQEEQYLIKLRMEMDNADSTEEQKEAARKSIENYYYYKYLKFLAEPLTEAEIKKLVEVYGDKKKIDYWIQRSRDKLKQKGMNPKIILEISKFEINYLEEKYHCISNALLLRFIHICTFADMSGPNDVDRSKVLSLVMSLDGIIRNIITGENRDNILNNVRGYLDQILDPLKEAYPVEVGEYYKRKSEA